MLNPLCRSGRPVPVAIFIAALALWLAFPAAPLLADPPAGEAGSGTVPAGAAVPAAAPVTETQPAAQTRQSWGGLFFDLVAMAGLDNRKPVADGYLFTAEDFAEFTRRPAFGTAGFSIRSGWFLATAGVEVQQDPGAILLGGAWSNLPKAPDSWSIMWGNTYPQFGYAQGSWDGWFVSAGRRRVGFGPGDLSLSMSAENPWFDHILAAVEVPAGASRIGYSFAAFGVQRWWGIPKKTVFSHRLSIRGKRFSLTVGERNLVVGDSIDLQDVGPLLIYHHLFNSASNVALDVEAQVLPLDSLRFYGQFVMDDFRLPMEDVNSNPTALGFLAGMDLAILPGKRDARPAMFREDHRLNLSARPTGMPTEAQDSGRTLDVSPFAEAPLRGGLSLKVELCATSTYLYRRNISSPYEAWTGRYFIQTTTPIPWSPVEPFLSGSVTPDTWRARAALRGAMGPFEAEFVADFRLLGAGSSVTTYEPPYAASWFGPQDPVTRRLDLGLNVRWSATPNVVLFCQGAASFMGSETGLSLYLGAGWRLGAGGFSTGDS